MPSPTPTEAQRDQIPAFRAFRDLAGVSTESLERTVQRLGEAITTLREKSPGTNRQPLLDGLADCEREIIRRIIASGRTVHDPIPSDDVIRISHRSGRSAWMFGGAA